MSNKQKYQSVYGAKTRIRADQYLVELVIQRRADRKNITLPDRFWAVKRNGKYAAWVKIFGSELTHARRIFDQFDEDCVVKAFEDYECRAILTLSNKKLTQLAGEYQKQKELQKAAQENIELDVVSTDTAPRKQQGKKSRLSKLK